MKFWFTALLGSAFATSLGASDFKFKDVDDKSLGLWEKDAPVFVYNHGVMLKPGVPADRARSTYLHPIYGLNGEVITDDFPKDHYHHRGLFWAWPHVKAAGKEYDLWMIKGVEQRFDKWIKKETGTTALLELENGWYAGPKKIMREQVSIRAHPASPESRAIDVKLVLTPIGDPISLTGAEGKSYGGLTLRFAPSTNIVITTPLGNGKEDLPMTRLPWADFSALFSGAAAPSGAAIFIAPGHPDYPPMWLTRHYGVLCVGWPGTEGKALEPNQPVTLQYRVWIHNCAVDGSRLQQEYGAYKSGAK